jgi:ADP-heptose:LPS heptosyltransferase
MFNNYAAKVRWHVNEWMQCHLGLLQLAGGRLSVLDSFGAPGDTLLAATVCRILKENFPALRINLITRWPDLVRNDPCLAEINGSETYFTLRFWYLEMVQRKERSKNVLMETLGKVGIQSYDYRARVHLTPHERREGERKLASIRRVGRPLAAFNTMSKEQVKNWPRHSWVELLHRLADDFTLVHLGDDREPVFDQVARFAGQSSMRESMAILGECDVYIGPDSFLMHAANGLDVPSVIIFGGSRPSCCLGYAENVNLYVPMPCGPCWLHDSRGDLCPYNIACMKEVSVDEVKSAVQKLKARIALLSVESKSPTGKNHECGRRC